MTTFVRCGQLFTGRENAARRDCTLVVGDDGLISYAGPTAEAPAPPTIRLPCASA